MLYKLIRALHFDTILRPTNHDALRDGIEYNKFVWTKSTDQLKSPLKNSLFHSLKVIYLIYTIVDFMHCMHRIVTCVCCQVYIMQLKKIQRATLRC